MYLDIEMCLDTSILATSNMDWREYVFSNCVKNHKMIGILIEYVLTGDRGAISDANDMDIVNLVPTS
jgi:hypothetical protein